MSKAKMESGSGKEDLRALSLAKTARKDFVWETFMWIRAYLLVWVVQVNDATFVDFRGFDHRSTFTIPFDT